LSIDSRRSPACAAAATRPRRGAGEPRAPERDEQDRADDEPRDEAADDALERLGGEMWA
jgi:hypothetical protein